MNVNKYAVLRPIITERSMEAAKNGKFTFALKGSIDKNAIKQAIEKLYSVHVVGISSTMVKGRRKRVGTKRVQKRMTPYKKAVVELKKGEKIDIFEIAAA